MPLRRELAKARRLINTRDIVVTPLLRPIGRMLNVELVPIADAHQAPRTHRDAKLLDYTFIMHVFAFAQKFNGNARLKYDYLSIFKGELVLIK